MFVIFVLEPKQITQEVHITKASKTAKQWETQGVKFRISGVKYYQ